MNILFFTIIAILVLQFLVETILDYFNAQHYGDPIPDALEDVFDAEEYQKSQEYQKTNYRFGFLSSLFSIILTLAFLVFGGFEWADQLARNFSNNEIVVTLIFFGILTIGSDILTTPFSYYQTFVIEERFGFNKSTKKLFFTDKLKGWLIMAILGGGVITLAMWFYQWAGPNFWLYVWGLVTAIIVFMNLFYSKLIVPLFNKQTPLEEGSLKSKIQNYANKVGFEFQNIFVIDGSKRSAKANAYFSGFGREKRVTLYDTLIKDLDEEEIVAVLAHEVGHYKHKHIIFNLVASIATLGLTLFILSLFINNPEVSKAIGVSQPSFHAALIGFGILYSPISEVTSLVMNFLSRKFEYQADDYAKDTFAAQPLITSLKKLSKNSLSNLTPHPAYVFMHYSHPPLIQRIKNLMA
ncbi:M48 family metallopeptidase [Maribacter algarum]|uniref:M48 family metallopeptidase n=1 Tax=Maribacter algarum (ex Zhang et al. 2020) TaxID=2578118 RepID=A0A5S3PHZ4_9FLAO|nr:M48 family metallopeptidase [Maribacter algarum]TMM53904.1 M48 family metallopeptidase [Maribacter algarum]